MKYYNDKKRLYTSPEIGDQIFFYSSDKSQISHTAYVYKTDSTYVYTVEGNTSGDSGVMTRCCNQCSLKYLISSLKRM